MKCFRPEGLGQVVDNKEEEEVFDKVIKTVDGIFWSKMKMKRLSGGEHSKGWSLPCGGPQEGGGGRHGHQIFVLFFCLLFHESSILDQRFFQSKVYPSDVSSKD